MKRKLVTVLLLVFFSVLAAYALEVKVDEKKQTAVNVRAEPKPKAEDVGDLLLNQVAQVVDEKVAYYKAKIDDVKRGAVEGWVWGVKVEKDEKGLYVGGGGTTLRKAASKNSETDGSVWPRSRITKVLDKYITWYKVKAGDVVGWVYAANLVVVEVKK